jgi:hypothetical protein
MRARMASIVFLLSLAGSAFAAEEKVLVPQGQLAPVKGVDLGIADDEDIRQPNSWGEPPLF